jgi:hypothetical protein
VAPNQEKRHTTPYYVSSLVSVCQIVDVICPEADYFPVGEVASFVETSHLLPNYRL